MIWIITLCMITVSVASVTIFVCNYPLLYVSNNKLAKNRILHNNDKSFVPVLAMLGEPVNLKDAIFVFKLL